VFRSACRKPWAERRRDGSGSSSARDGNGCRRCRCCCGEQFYEIPHVLEPPTAGPAQLLPGPIGENSGFVLAPCCKPRPPGQRLQFRQSAGVVDEVVAHALPLLSNSIQRSCGDEKGGFRPFAFPCWIERDSLLGEAVPALALFRPLANVASRLCEVLVGGLTDGLGKLAFRGIVLYPCANSSRGAFRCLVVRVGVTGTLVIPVCSRLEHDFLALLVASFSIDGPRKHEHCWRSGKRGALAPQTIAHPGRAFWSTCQTRRRH
jgi:hypothetical protein